MDHLNLFLFNLIYNFGKSNFLLIDLGVFLAKYLLYLLIILLFYFVLFSNFNLNFKNIKKARIILFIEIILAAILSRGIITEFIRFFWPEPRPFDFLGIKPFIFESGPGLPSGHASFLFAISMIIFLWNKKWGIIYFILSLINGLARIFVGVHWPLDILAGLLIGVLSALFIHLIFKKEINLLIGSFENKTYKT
ncbi:MAG: phosphatase PAP2 family protein [Minisyncoccia bacterium]